jgi:hypothetical protein
MEKIEIDNKLVLKIYLDETSQFPSLLQATRPDGTPWADKAEATAWAKVFVAEKKAEAEAILEATAAEDPDQTEDPAPTPAE